MELSPVFSPKFYDPPILKDAAQMDDRRSTIDIFMKKKVEKLLKELKQNPFNVDIHTQLIHLHQNSPSQLTYYRELMATYCPTTEEFWSEWIYDEKQHFNSDHTAADDNAFQGEHRVIHLYKRALHLVPTADLWVDYLKFLNQFNASSRVSVSVGATHLRRHFEAALNELGNHITEGPKIWAYYRHFEQKLLNASLFSKEFVNDEIKAVGDCTLQHQINRVRQLFKRQLGLPLAGRQDVLDGYRVFEAELPESLRASQQLVKEFEDLYAQGTEQWEARRSFEQDVTPTSEWTLDEFQRLSNGWKKYIEFEKFRGPITDQYTRVSTVWSRACEDLGHIFSQLWLCWAQWVINLKKDYAYAATLLNRASRHHPFEPEIWKHLLASQTISSPTHFDKIRHMSSLAITALSVYPDQVSPKCIVVMCTLAVQCALYSYTIQEKTAIKQQTMDVDQTINPIPHPSKTDCDERMKHQDPAEYVAFASKMLIYGQKLLLAQINSNYSKEKNSTESHRELAQSESAVKNSQTNTQNSTKDGVTMDNLYCLYRNELHLHTSFSKDFTKAAASARQYLNLTHTEPSRPFREVTGAHWAEALSELKKVMHKQEDQQEMISLIQIGCDEPICSHRKMIYQWSLDFVKEYSELVTSGLRIRLEEGLKASAEECPLDVVYCTQIPTNEAELYKIIMEVLPIDLEAAHITTGIPTIEENDHFNDHSSMGNLTEADLKLFQISLKELQTRRIKRRRRLSESESDATYSDCSSDSGTCVLSHFDGTNPESRNSNAYRKKLKSTQRKPNSYYFLAGVDPPSTATTESCYTDEKPLCSDSVDLPGASGAQLTRNEIHAIEHLTRSTWNGCECTDPSTAPPIAPITSPMSPLIRSRRRNSVSSESSSTPSATTADTLESSPRPSHLFFVDASYHTREKLSSEDEDGPAHKKARFSISENDSETIQSISAQGVEPKKGKHYLQGFNSNSPAADVQHLLGSVAQSSTIYLSNLDRLVREEDIKDLFKDTPGLKQIRLVRDFRRRSKGFCYVDFETPEMARNAISMKQHSKINHRRIKMAISKPPKPIYEECTIFISKLPLLYLEKHATNIETLLTTAIQAAYTRHTQQSPPAIKSVRLIKNHDGQFKGYGYVDFLSKEDTLRALEIPPEELILPNEDQMFTLAPSVPMKRHSWIAAPPTSKKIIHKTAPPQMGLTTSQVLFVKNLNYSTTELSLHQHFKAHCDGVQSVQICRDAKGQSKGYGFVTFDSPQHAFSGHMLNDSTLSKLELRPIV